MTFEDAVDVDGSRVRLTLHSGESLCGIVVSVDPTIGIEVKVGDKRRWVDLETVREYSS